MDSSSSNNSTNTTQQATTVFTDCRICGAPAQYSYYGVVSCGPCKMFFKRNAELGLETMKCNFDGHCDININTRHTCSYCRLLKCFASGMQTEMLRSSYPKTNRNNQKCKTMGHTGPTTSVALVKANEPEQIPTLNLLRADLSTLTVDQWNLLSNLSHCYDEHSGLSIGERYMLEQNILPLKLRFKSASIMDLYQKLVDGTQLLYKNNRDFLSVPAVDRSTLLHNTTTHAAGLSLNFILYHIGLLTNPAYSNAIGVLIHPNAASCIQRIADRIDLDIILLKLMLAILSFSTMSYTFYSNTPPVNLSNLKQILQIQDTYTELMWRYLLYKHNHEQAVKCCSDLIRCLFVINESIITAHDIQWVKDMMNSFIQQTEQSLTVIDWPLSSSIYRLL